MDDITPAESMRLMVALLESTEALDEIGPAPVVVACAINEGVFGWLRSTVAEYDPRQVMLHPDEAMRQVRLFHDTAYRPLAADDEEHDHPQDVAARDRFYREKKIQLPTEAGHSHLEDEEHDPLETRTPACLAAANSVARYLTAMQAAFPDVARYWHLRPMTADAEANELHGHVGKYLHRVSIWLEDLGWHVSPGFMQHREQQQSASLLNQAIKAMSALTSDPAWQKMGQARQEQDLTAVSQWYAGVKSHLGHLSTDHLYRAYIDDTYTPGSLRVRQEEFSRLLAIVRAVPMVKI